MQMSMQGLHLLLTYKCNARCRHCFLSAGPDRREVFSSALAKKIIDEASLMSTVNHLFVEGGEPFLFPELLLSTIRYATDRGFWIGALTNGFWAISEQKAQERLKPLVAAGLKSLSISTDAWHEEFVPVSRVNTAVAAARALGLKADVMYCESGPATDGAESAPFSAGDIVCRGRAASNLCVNGNKDWRSLTTCPEELESPGRVHIDPLGEIHLCQGLLLGETATEKSLNKIFEDYQPENHPLVASLAAGGPAELARFAKRYGWEPSQGYVDGCQLCSEVRKALKEQFPKLIGPAFVFTN